MARGHGRNDARRRVNDPFILLKGFLRRNPIGALAQLGEHLLCKQRVIGSIPIGSTKTSLCSALLEPIDSFFSRFCAAKAGGSTRYLWAKPKNT